jgi:hypothetical protein
VEANFADQRTYVYNNEPIDTAYHLGYDLSVTKRYPVARSAVTKQSRCERNNATKWPGMLVNTSGWLFVAGTIVFCGSLYALSRSGVRWRGMITPLAGLAFLADWICLVAAALRVA